MTGNALSRIARRQLLLLICGILPGVAQAAQAAILDPIPEKIQPSSIHVVAVPFLEAPATADAHDQATVVAGIDVPLVSSGARARLQYLMPVPGPSGRLAVSDLRGVLYLMDSDGSNLRPWIDLRTEPDFGGGIFPNEAGFLGFAFHPEFERSGSPGFGRVYLGYSVISKAGTADFLDEDSSSHQSVLAEWVTDDPMAPVFKGTSRELLRIGQFAPNHNIGTLAFDPTAAPDSPDYGNLYICMGDGGAAFDVRDHGQRLSTPMGAILRIDPLGGTASNQYGIPADNPFVNHPSAAREIWAWGLRHPQQFSFDRQGRMFINDIGQNQVEEVNLGAAGANYGWRQQEGTFASGYTIDGASLGPIYPRTADTPPVASVDPIAQYDHDEGNAISSGFIYEGSAIQELRGHYVFADLVQGRIFHFDARTLPTNGTATIQELNVTLTDKSGAIIEGTLLAVAGHGNTYDPSGTLRADLRLGRDHSGELYLLTKGDGQIRRLAAATADRISRPPEP